MKMIHGYVVTVQCSTVLDGGLVIIVPINTQMNLNKLADIFRNKNTSQELHYGMKSVFCSM